MCRAIIQNSITEGGLSGGIAVLLHKGFPPLCNTCFLAQCKQSLFTQSEQPGMSKSITKISISGMCCATIQNGITKCGLSGGIAVHFHKRFPPDCGTCFLAQCDQSLFTQPEQPGMSKATYVVTFPVRTF